MRSLKQRGIVFGLVLIGLTSGSCSNGGAPPAPPEDVGTMGFQLQVAPGVTLSSVGWSIANAGSGFSRSGSANVQSSNTIQFQVGNLPTGSGFTITLTAASADGSLTCIGSATFTVTAGMTTGVALTLVCTPRAPDAGTIAVSATAVVCPSVTSLSAAPLEAAVGTPIALSVTASAGATFAWTATAGTFDDASSAAPTFTCPATAGPVTITVTAGPSNPLCTSASQSITVTCDTLTPTFTNVYATVIGVRCTGCHRPGGGGFTVGGLDMSTQAAAYANLVGVAAAGTGVGTSGVTCGSLAPGLLRVRPGDSAQSLLHAKVSAKVLGIQPPCGSPMPTPATAAPLTQAQVDLIKAWIDAGALND
jgi:hypothetical protein